MHDLCKCAGEKLCLNLCRSVGKTCNTGTLTSSPSSVKVGAAGACGMGSGAIAAWQCLAWQCKTDMASERLAMGAIGAIGAIGLGKLKH